MCLYSCDAKEIYLDGEKTGRDERRDGSRDGQRNAFITEAPSGHLLYARKVISLLLMQRHKTVDSPLSRSLKNCGQVNTCGTCVPGPTRTAMRHTPPQNQRWGSVRVSEAEIVVLLCCAQRRLTWLTPCCIYSVTQLPWSTEPLFLSTEDFLSHNKPSNN